MAIYLTVFRMKKDFTEIGIRNRHNHEPKSHLVWKQSKLQIGTDTKKANGKTSEQLFPKRWLL